MDTKKKDEGILLVVSGPSGAGKGTICSAIRSIYPNLHYSVSMTTREPRKGEVEGESYYFRTNEQFEELIKEDAFLEYARVYDHYYGTPKKYALDLINEGKSVLLEIDIQGAMQVKKRYPKGVFIYIVPPSLKFSPAVSMIAEPIRRKSSKNVSPRLPANWPWPISMITSW